MSIHQEAGRNLSLDLIRGLGMIGIVLIHVHSYFTFFHNPLDPTQKFTLILANISRFSVPVFIFSAGYFCRDKNFKDFWNPKIISIIIPYMIACIIGYYIKFEDFDFFDLIMRSILGSVFTPFYFIPLLIQFYALYYFILRHLNRSMYLIFLFASLVINIHSNEGGFSFFDKEYYIISPTNFIFFFALGLNLSKSGKFKEIGLFLKERGFQKYIPIAWTINLVYLIYLTFLELTPMSNHTITYPTLSLFALYILFEKIDWSSRSTIGITGKLIAKIGENSLGIFLLHPFVIHFMHSIDPYLLGGKWLSIIITTAINIALPMLIWLSPEYLRIGLKGQTRPRI